MGVRRNPMSVWLRRSLDLLFPPHCVACARLGAWFCDDCLGSVEPVPEPICSCCGRPLARNNSCITCKTRPIQLNGIRSVGLHTGALRIAIHHLKYRQRRALAFPLGQLLYAYWLKVRIPSELILPVPLHPTRQKERGFNQAGLLANVLAQLTGLRLDARQLVRTRATPPQVGLGIQEREANVRDAFVWLGTGLENRQVLLIDDVCTTGATLEACARALRQQGVASIWALTLARPFESLAELSSV